MDKIKFTVGVSDNLVFVENSYDLSSNYSYLKNIININYSTVKEYNKQYKMGNILYGQVDYLDQNAYYEANTNSINLLLGGKFNGYGMNGKDCKEIVYKKTPMT